ncbi:AMP-binding protein [Rhodococcus qingshengii]|uniref:AMP-binding protein n=1 Tax=Rhodococcus qingshengii TaxID=334542 RepID=UPI0024BA28BA|nr:AMP-binding protein [Rhodococcus qingshengii]MDJ0489956.1 AMP-binding protein [Rhodococcus qingshengii]
MSVDPVSVETEAPPLTPDYWAERDPDRFAILVPDGRSMTYGELAHLSRTVAQDWSARGIVTGDRVAVAMENRADYLVVAVAALRTSVRLVAVGTHLTTDEITHVIVDSDARLIVTSARYVDTIRGAVCHAPTSPVVLVADDDHSSSGVEHLYRDQVDPRAEATAGELQGAFMFYSSGTTGKPKGILRDMPNISFAQGDPLTAGFAATWGFSEGSVWLNSAPLYHAYPLQSCTSVIRWGGTLVLTERFDAEQTLRLIERHEVSHISVVPTMFVRLLGLPENVRSQYDVTSLRCVIHAGAACAVSVKQAMMTWWGPILYEFYGGSENIGMVLIAPKDWLEHPGSVGKPSPGTISVLDDDGRPVAPGVRGIVWFEHAPRFSYHKSPEKTAGVFDASGRATLGDLGYLDEDGYLYLDGRRVDLIISGGVNIYPAEIEDRIAEHPAVFDVAVIGVPDHEFGQQVKAVVELEDGVSGSDELATALIAHTREVLAGYKCPKSVDFAIGLPRTPTGKLLKRVLLEQYWTNEETQRS